MTGDRETVEAKDEIPGRFFNDERQGRKSMEVILRADVANLGKRGARVSVKDGYARNFLIPGNLALPVTAGNARLIEEEKRRMTAAEERSRKEARVLAEKIARVSCTVKIKVGEGDKPFGAITVGDIAESLHQEGIDVDKKKIVLAEPINRLGIYHVPIKLHPEVGCQVKLWVIEE